MPGRGCHGLGKGVAGAIVGGGAGVGDGQQRDMLIVAGTGRVSSIWPRIGRLPGKRCPEDSRAGLAAASRRARRGRAFSARRSRQGIAFAFGRAQQKGRVKHRQGRHRRFKTRHGQLEPAPAQAGDALASCDSSAPAAVQPASTSAAGLASATYGAGQRAGTTCDLRRRRLAVPRRPPIDHAGDLHLAAWSRSIAGQQLKPRSWPARADDRPGRYGHHRRPALADDSLTGASGLLSMKIVLAAKAVHRTRIEAGDHASPKRRDRLLDRRNQAPRRTAASASDLGQPGRAAPSATARAPRPGRGSIRAARGIGDRRRGRRREPTKGDCRDRFVGAHRDLPIEQRQRSGTARSLLAKYTRENIFVVLAAARQPSIEKGQRSTTPERQGLCLAKDKDITGTSNASAPTTRKGTEERVEA